MSSSMEDNVGKTWVKLVVSLLVCQIAGVLGALFNSHALQSWYPGLIKPAFTPPGWVFGPVWTLLYILMGVALFRIWRIGTKTPGVRAAMVLFGIHLLSNAAWSAIFFGLRLPIWAFGEILILWGLILACILAFRRLDRTAAWLMIPYLAWVTFAALLNGAIAWLNR